MPHEFYIKYKSILKNKIAFVGIVFILIFSWSLLDNLIGGIISQ